MSKYQEKPRPDKRMIHVLKKERKINEFFDHFFLEKKDSLYQQTMNNEILFSEVILSYNLQNIYVFWDFVYDDKNYEFLKDKVNNNLNRITYLICNELGLWMTFKKTPKIIFYCCKKKKALKVYMEQIE